MKTFYKDLLLLSHVRENGRKKLTRLAKETRMPVSTIYDKLRLYRSIYIRKYTAILNFRNLGFSTRCLVAFKVSTNEKNILRDFLFKHRSVNSLCRVDNGFDYVAEMIFVSLEDLHNFLEFVERSFEVKKVTVFNVLEDLRREDFLASPRYLRLVNGIKNSLKVRQWA